MSDDTFDFGFTATTVEELDYIQQSKTQHQEETELLFKQVERNETKLSKLYDAIMPLLDNLEKDAESRDYIYWPKRKEKIDQFRAHLNKIYEGESS